MGKLVLGVESVDPAPPAAGRVNLYVKEGELIAQDHEGNQLIQQGAGGGDLVVIESGVIDTPIAYADFNLPSGYSSFELQFTGTVTYDSPYGGYDAFYAHFSPDGGATFTTDSSAYENAWLGVSGGLVDHGGFSGLGIWCGTGQGPQNGTKFNQLFKIFPGSATLAPEIIASHYQMIAGNTTCIATAAYGVFTGTPTTQNLVRIAPSGNMYDPNTPGSVETFIVGQYVLVGIKEAA